MSSTQKDLSMCEDDESSPESNQRRCKEAEEEFDPLKTKPDVTLSNKQRLQSMDSFPQSVDGDESPDISLSSQNVLRYSDVEASHDEDEECSNTSHRGSVDGIQTEPALSLGYGQMHTSWPPLPSTEEDDIPVLFSEEASADDHGQNSAQRPESLPVSSPFDGKKHRISSTKEKTTTKSEQQSDIKGAEGTSQMEDIAEEALSPSSLPQGTIVRKGDMIEFVADDLQQKIKESVSPIAQTDSGSQSSRRSSEYSIVSASSSTSFATSSNLSRSPSSLLQASPEAIPPIDPEAVRELEGQAKAVADSLDLMMGNIRNNLHKMSAITIGCQEAYKRSVDITCDSVDTSIKSMYALMAKCEELGTAMTPVSQLATQIKEIKRILDLFEAQISDK